jgi:hypothetical protein
MGQHTGRAVDRPWLRDFALAEATFAEDHERQLGALCWAASIVAEMVPGPAQDAAEDRLSHMISVARVAPDQLAWVRRLRADGQQSSQWCARRPSSAWPRRSVSRLYRTLVQRRK